MIEFSFFTEESIHFEFKESKENQLSIYMID